MRLTHSALLALPAIALLAACGAANAETETPAPAPQAAEAQPAAQTTAMAEAETPALNLPAGTYVSDLSHSSIIWKVDHLGLSDYTARFNDFEATLDIDPNDPESASLTVTIDPASVSTGYPFTDQTDFDAKVGGDERLLNSGAFPEITFVSTDVDVTGPDTASVTGDLTMLGTTLPLTLDVTFNGALESHPFSKRPMLGFSATGALDRTDFGMTYLSSDGVGIGDEVQIVVQAEFGTDPVAEE
ncbi:MAG: YceI family protein [Pseudomonadota bacterium]